MSDLERDPSADQPVSTGNGLPVPAGTGHRYRDEGDEERRPVEEP